MTKEEMHFGVDGHNVYRSWGHPFGRHADIWLFHSNFTEHAIIGLKQHARLTFHVIFSRQGLTFYYFN